MKDIKNVTSNAVSGLMDVERIALELGVKQTTVRGWIDKKRKGKGAGPKTVAGRFPAPLPETLNGGCVWTVDSFVPFKAGYTPPKLRTSNQARA